MGAQGHLSKPVVSQNIALHAVPAYRASAYLVSAFPTHSTSFSPNLVFPVVNGGMCHRVSLVITLSVFRHDMALRG